MRLRHGGWPPRGGRSKTSTTRSVRRQIAMPRWPYVFRPTRIAVRHWAVNKNIPLADATVVSSGRERCMRHCAILAYKLTLINNSVTAELVIVAHGSNPSEALYKAGSRTHPWRLQTQDQPPADVMADARGPLRLTASGAPQLEAADGGPKGLGGAGNLNGARSLTLSPCSSSSPCATGRTRDSSTSNSSGSSRCAARRR